MRNHLGGLECRLCLTLHTNEGSYLAHTQGKKHQTNLARRAARDAHDPNAYAAQLAAQAAKPQVQTKTFLKIGVPGYQVRPFRRRCPILRPRPALTCCAGPFSRSPRCATR